MSSENHSPLFNGTVEDSARDLLHRAQDNVSEKMHRYEDSVRESPTNSVLVAGIVGYFFHLLPIGALLSAAVRLVASLIRPAVFLYVAAKLIEALRNSSNKEAANQEREMVTP